MAIHREGVATLQNFNIHVNGQNFVDALPLYTPMFVYSRENRQQQFD